MVLHRFTFYGDKSRLPGRPNFCGVSVEKKDSAPLHIFMDDLNFVYAQRANGDTYKHLAV